MDAYLVTKYIHILSAAVLFGVGLGTAFSMVMADRTNNPAVIAGVAKNVVLADWVFTTPAVLIQPATGILLVRMAGHAWSDTWLIASVALYMLTGLCWLPVVWLQIQMRNDARAAVQSGAGLPPRHRNFMRLWFFLGWPAFASVMVIFWLMISRPQTVF